MRIFSFARNSLIAIMLVFMSLTSYSARAGSVSYDVVIDTSSFAGQSGDVEFQLAGMGRHVPITASFDNYLSRATLNGPTASYPTISYLAPLDPPNRDFSGDLSANTLSMYNDDSSRLITDVDQLVTSFDTSMSFRVTLSGDGIGETSLSTSTLAISVFDSSNNPLFSGPPETNSAAVFIQTRTDGTSFLTQYNASSVPEPSSIVSMLLGAFGIGIGMYRRTKRTV